MRFRPARKNFCPLDDSRYTDPGTPLANLSFLYLDNFQNHVEMVEGDFPPPSDPDGPVKIAIPIDMANQYFMNVGDRFNLEKFDIEIYGIWQISDPTDKYWFSDPVGSYKDKIWVPEETYRTRVAPAVNKPVFFTSWYIIMDENSLNFQRAPQYARALMRLEAELKEALPSLKIDYTPLEVLLEYQKRAESLATLLYAVSAPMVVLAMLFISLTSNIAVQQYEQEIATLRGRGTSRVQVMLMNLFETLILLILAAPLSAALGWLAAMLMGNTLSFLQFVERDPLILSYEGISWPGLAGVAFLIVVSRFWPTLEVVRVSIVRMKQQQSRGVNKPIWERLFIDIILLGVGLYAFSTMRGWTKPSGLLASMKLSGEQYRDPLLFVAPALFAIAVCMFSLRIIPLLIRLLAAIVERLPGVWAYLSLQQIARRPQDHSNALLLIMISLSLAIYSASTAKTLDQWLYDSEYYRAGTDLVVQEYILAGGESSGYGPPGGSSAATLQELDVFSTGFTAIDAHMKLPTIQAAARVGRYSGSFSFGTGEVKCQVLGIDRLEFPQVAFFRDDFAGKSLGALMNDLAAVPNGVLLPKKVTDEMGLQIGDQLSVSIMVGDAPIDREMVLAGIYSYFPTVYPTDPPAMVINLESIFDNPDAVMGYGMWLKLKPDAIHNVVLFQLRQMIGGDKAVVKVNGDALTAIRQGQDKPERQGLFGVLSVGFMMTGLMPGIGFVLYSYASLRRRFIQLGILQAIGLSVPQLIGYLALEQFLLMGLSIISGALIGLLTSVLFVPFLQVGAAPGAPVPPFWVLIGWNEAAYLSLAFGVILFMVVIGTITYLARLKVFQAVKLGETL